MQLIVKLFRPLRVGTLIRVRLLALLFPLFAVDSYSQTPQWQWIRGGGGVSSWFPSRPGSPDDEIVDIEVDSIGNVYVAGRIFTSISAKISSTTINKMRGYRDGVVAKFNCDGQLQWYKVIGGKNIDRVNDIELDNYGNIYVTGGMSAGAMLTDSAYIGNVAYRFWSSQCYLTKLDSNGNIIWTHIAYSTNTNNTILTASVGYSVGVDRDDNVYLYGTSESKGAQFYPGVELNETHFLAKYSDAGNLLWAEKLMPFPSQILIQEMKVANDGRCYMVGTLRDTIVIGGTQFNPMNINGESIVLEYDSSGSYVWGHISESQVLSNGFRIEVNEGNTNNDQFYIVGNTTDGAKFGTLVVPNSTSGGPGYIVKYENHTPVWLRHIDYQYPNSVNAVSIDAFENVYIASEVRGNKTSIAGMKVQGQDGDPFVAKLTSVGDTVISRSLSSNFGGTSLALAAGFNGNFYIGGSYEQQIGIPGESIQNAGGNTDLFIAKFGIEECEDTTTVDTTLVGLSENIDGVSSFQIYPNPNSGIFNIELDNSDQRTIQVYNAIGALVYSKSSVGNKLIKIRLPDGLDDGVYFIHLLSKNFSQSMKIIIQMNGN